MGTGMVAWPRGRQWLRRHGRRGRSAPGRPLGLQRAASLYASGSDFDGMAVAAGPSPRPPTRRITAVQSRRPAAQASGPAPPGPRGAAPTLHGSLRVLYSSV